MKNPNTSTLFKKNRVKFTDKLLPNSIAFFNSNDVYPLSSDSVLPFKQHSDIFYLSGINQEESILVLYPDALEKENQEILFVQETNEHIKIWEGEKLTKEQATEISGIKNIQWIQNFDSVVNSLLIQSENIYINLNENPRANTEVQTREDRFIEKIKRKYPAHTYKRSNPILQNIRSIKEPEEIELIQKACNITEKTFCRILKFAKPNVWEYEIEAEMIHEFTRSKTQGHAFSPIIASGKNATILHYLQNNKQCKDGELVLLDFGCQYNNYNSDMTRVIPVNGKFNPRQKEVYQAVLNVKNYATSLLVDGLTFKEYNKEVGNFMTSELIKLKLLDKVDIQNQNEKNPAYKKYFMHGTSHFLGLDTHDYGNYNNPIKENMVLTVEPGIYIPNEKIGIRLEDDVVVQKDKKPINLLTNSPIEIEEIEELMNNN
ncbi:MAG: aminopeptidase P family protein [Flavobacteriales bacterium]|nr:aminopeptidase P family protein [Flavobacteriales bacterium]